MKKYLVAIILLLASITLAPFSYQEIYASNTLNIETIYPDKILDYTDLSNITAFSINTNYIAYTLDKSTITILHKDSRKYTNISGFNNIQKIKFAKNKILVSDKTSIRIIDLDNLTNPIEQLDTLSEISLHSLKAIDIFVTDNKILISTITNDTLKLYEYSIDLIATKTNPIKTSQSSYFLNAYMMAINNNNAYIVYNPDNPTKPTGLCIQNFTTTTPIIKDDFKPYAKIIDTIYYDDSEYILTFTNDIFYLLNSDGSVVSNVNIETQANIDSNHFPILKVTDIDFFDDKIYVSDCLYKTIQTFDISKNDSNALKLESHEIILCSSSFDYGRFNNVQDIFLQGSTIFVSDSGNNRIQYIKDNKSHIIADLETDSYPKNVVVDNQNNLYFIKNDSYKSTLCKYTFNNDKYSKEIEFNKINNLNIGFISDICITNSNIIYMLDYTNNKLLYLSSNGIEEVKNSITSLELNEKSRLKYLKGLNKLVILNNSCLYILNNNGTISNQITLQNCKNITVDFDKIYAISDNSINLVSISNDELIVESSTINISNNPELTAMTFDIINRQMIAFDNNRSCLVSFACELAPKPFIHNNITTKTPLTDSDTLLAITLKTNSLIYEYPYEIGNYFNQDQSISNCIGIGEYREYYEVLINNNNELKIGYVLKSNANIQTYNYAPIEVLTTNQIVPVYKYPTLLRYNNERLINSTIKHNTQLTLQYMFPISIDEKTFYMYKQQNTIGFIFSIDIVGNQNSNIKNLNTENASIKLIGEEKTYLYNEDKQTKILEINNNARIYVENYDKNCEYTYIIYKDSDLNTYEGYVLTENIQMDELDNSQLVLILIIAFSIIILILIIIAYFIIKKRNK